MLPLRLYRVAGSSMQPSLNSGDLVLAWRWFRPRQGQIVVVNHNGRPLIKRVKQVRRDSVWVEGDNWRQSTDSRHFGAVNKLQLRGRLVAKIG